MYSVYEILTSPRIHLMVAGLSFFYILLFSQDEYRSLLLIVVIFYAATAWMMYMKRTWRANREVQAVQTKTPEHTVSSIAQKEKERMQKKAHPKN